MQIIEQKIVNIIQDTLLDFGFDLVKVSMRNSRPKVLEILIDRLDAKQVTIADCQIISKNISVLLDIADIINDKYYLEVSSAGIERLLLKFEDYGRFVDRFVAIKLKEPVNEQICYQGKIVKAEDNQIHLDLKGEYIVVPFTLIKSASLVLTDEMFRNLLNKES